MRLRHALVLFAAAMLAASTADARTSPVFDYYCEAWHAYYPAVLVCPVPWRLAVMPHALARVRARPPHLGAPQSTARTMARARFRAIGDGLDRWCSRVKLPSSIAICSDATLRALALERQRAFDLARSRLPPARRKALLANESAWVKTYSVACGLSRVAPPALPLSPSIKNCMAEAGRDRIAYLQTYKVAALHEAGGFRSSAAPINEAATASAPPSSGTTTISPQSPRRLQSPGEDAHPQGGALAKPTPATGSEVASSTVNAPPPAGSNPGFNTQSGDGPLIGALLVGITAIVIVIALLQARRRAVRGRREIESVCQYFDRLNTTRSFPSVAVPLVLEHGEFGLLCSPAKLYDIRARRASDKVENAIIVATSILRQGYPRRRLKSTNSGTLVLTNHRIIFSSDADGQTLQFRMTELSDAECDGHLRVAVSQKQTPIILDLAEGHLAAMLIRSFADGIFRHIRIPDGLTISADPNASGRGVDLRLQLPRLINLVHAMVSTEVGPPTPKPIADGPVATDMPRLAAIQLE